MVGLHALLLKDAGEFRAGFWRPRKFIPEPGPQLWRLPAQSGEQRDGRIVGVLGQQFEDETIDAIFIGGVHGR